MSMAVKYDVDANATIQFIRHRYVRLLAAEAGRVVKRHRNRAVKDFHRTLIQHNLISRRMTQAVTRKMIHLNPASHSVSGPELLTGFTRTVEASNVRPNLWTVAKAESREVMTRTGRKWQIWVSVAGKVNPEAGAFWVIGKRWRKTLGAGKGPALGRLEYPNPNIVRPKAGSNAELGTVKAPSIPTLFKIAKIDESFVSDRQVAFAVDLNQKLAILHDKISRGVVR